MEKDDVELIQNILAGDEAAFSTLVKKYQKGVHALVWRKVKDFHIAEEITQDTFLQVHKKLASLKNPSQFPGWLYVIADRLCRAWFRKKQLKKQLDTQSLEAISEETLEKTAYSNYVREQREDVSVEHQRQIVQKLMEKLPESERTVMVLYYLGEMNREEISKFLGVSPNTVKSRLQRARKRLRNEEHIIRETLSSVPLHPNLIENIMRNIDPVKQPSSSAAKPLLPLAALGSSVILVILLMGASHQYIAHFQQPYSVDAQSEPTIEIIDAPIVLNSESKRDLQNRVGNGTTPGRNSNNGLSKGTETVENNLTQDPMQWNLPKDAKARIGKGETNAIQIQHSPDGKLFAVASGIGIWLYDVATRREIALLTEHTSVVDRLAFSPDGRTFASGSKDGTILLWGYRSADGRASVQTKLTVDREELSGLNLAFSPDGKTLASGTGYAIQFWDTVTGEQKSAIPSFSKFLSFSPDGATLIVCADQEGTINLWNPITGKHKKMIPGNIDRVVSVALSPNGKTIAMGSYDGPIHLYDLDTSENKITLSGHKWQIRSLAFSPDGRTLVSGGWDQTIRLWDVETGEHKQTLTGHKDWVRSLAFSPDGKIISSGSGDGTIRFWDADTGSFQNTIAGYATVAAITFSPNGRTLSTEYGDGTIRLWDADTGQHIKTYNEFRDMISSGVVRNIIAFTPGRKTLAWDGWGDDGMRLLDVDTDEHRVILTISKWGNHSVEFSPDGNIIAISFRKGNLIKLWDMHTSEQKLTLTGHTEDIFRLAFSPDSKTLASTSDDDTIRLWDAQTGENKEVFTLDSAWRRDVADWRIDSTWCGVAFSPDGKTLAGGGGEIILLWDIDTGKTKIRLTMPTHRVFDLAFSPDGKTLASAGFESNINLWDPHTGEHKKTLTGHRAWVRSIAFSPDGKSLGSRSDDGTVLIWEITP